MKLTKPMLMAFSLIMGGENTVIKLAHALHKSIKWADNIINALEDEGFISKKANYTLKGSRFQIEIAPTPYSHKLKELLFEYSGISLEEVITESRLFFLTAISEDWMSISLAAKLSRISKHSIERYRPKLMNLGILKKKKNLYTINEKAWPLVKEFLIVYKNYAVIDGHVKWKYNEEILFEVNNEKLIQNNATGLYTYKNHGVKAGVVSALCYLPKKKLSKEEIFVHSLYEIKDPRTLYLGLTFYLKNKLSYNKVMPIAMKYGKYSIFENFNKLLRTNEERVNTNILPGFERKDFIRMLDIYGVKNV